MYTVSDCHVSKRERQRKRERERGRRASESIIQTRDLTPINTQFVLPSSFTYVIRGYEVIKSLPLVSNITVLALLYIN